MRTSWLLLAIAAAAGATWARAASAGDAALVVMLENDDAAPPESATLDAIRAQVGDLPVKVRLERHARFADLRAQMDYAAHLASSSGARGVFWVNADVSGDVLLFMLDPDGDRLLLRRIEGHGASEAVTEEVANVAHAIVEALAEGQRVGMTAVPVPAPPPPPPSPRPHPPPARRTPPAPRPIPHPRPPPRRHVPAPGVPVWTQAGWAGSTWASGVPWTHGAALGVEARLTRGLLLRADYTFFLPATVAAQGTTLQLARHPADVAFGWEGTFGRLGVGAELGATLDPVGRATLAVAEGLTPAPDGIALTFALSPRARAALRLLPWVEIYLRGGVDVFLAQPAYAIGPTTLVSPDVVRARIDSGLSFRVF